jgi:hypothetical protein
MNHQWPNIKGGTKCFGARRLFGVHLGCAPHSRTRRKNLQGVRANLPRLLDGIGNSARGSKMNADALGHGNSVMDRQA